MPFTPKDWVDAPTTTTPITSSALEDLETRTTAYTDTTAALNSGYIINAGTLGTAYTPALANHQNVVVTATLNANCTISAPTGLTAGASFILELHQDSTGGWAVTFPTAVQPAGALAVSQPALSVTTVSFYSPDGSSLVGFSSASVTTLSKYDRDPGLPGMLCFDHAGASAGNTVTADEIHLSRFVPTRDMVITTIRVPISTASGTDAALQAGIYDSTLGTLLASTAQTSGLITSSGAKSVSLTSSVSLVAGTVYYAALVFHGGDAALRTVAWSLGSFAAASLLGASIPQALGARKTATWPLPASISSPSISGTINLVAVME